MQITSSFVQFCFLVCWDVNLGRQIFLMPVIAVPIGIFQWFNFYKIPEIVGDFNLTSFFKISIRAFQTNRIPAKSVKDVEKKRVLDMSYAPLSNFWQRQ